MAATVGAALAATAATIDEAAFARCAAMADAQGRLACYDALAGRATAAKPAAAPAPAPATTPAPAPGDFGLPRHRTPEERAGVTAHLVGPLREWEPGTLFRLDNGQVWKATSEEKGYYPNIPDNAEVTIKESFFGGYLMEIRAIGRKIRVKRIS